MNGGWTAKKTVMTITGRREGFIEVSLQDMREGDMIMMRIQSPVTNHCGDLLG